MKVKEITGLTSAQVEESRLAHGNNILTPPERKSVWRQFLRCFGDPLIIILMVAAMLSVGISCYEYFMLHLGRLVFIEPVGIFAAIFLATGLSFIFEHKAEKEFDLLNQVSDEEPVQVIRDGAYVMIPRRDVVVGDVMVLDTGQEIPADGRLLESMSLSVDESSLTGEPLCRKSADPEQFNPDDTFPSDAVMRGTKVMEGHGIAVVTAVGDATENGRTMTAARIDRSVVTPLDEQLGRLGHLISVMSYIIGALVIAGRTIMYLSEAGGDWDWAGFITYTLQSVMLAVTLVVVSVPEGLPMAVTLSLAYSMRRMLRTGNLVRRLHACETMGAVTVICTDKTGTLTQNRMHVEDMYLSSDPHEAAIATESMAVNSTANINLTHPDNPEVLGNPTEGALLLWLAGRGDDIAAMRRCDITQQLPFSTRLKYMATTYRSAADGDRLITVVKGAPEIIMDLCDKSAAGIDPERLRAILTDRQRRGMRTLAFAYADGAVDFAEGCIGSHDLTLLGAASISDPVRADVPPAIAECRRAGIDVKIVTGDTSATAREIGRSIGLIDDDTPDSSIVTGPEVEAMSDDELQQRARSIAVIARARPMDKKRLVEALQRCGEVVAVTGDGTNDAPALKTAHIGLAMGDGTSVAREAADITIVNNSFSGIGNAVMWGRSLYRNIQRFLLFQLTVNVAACLTVLAGSFMGTAAPLTVTQMLWVNLVMDTFAALALASLPPARDVMNHKPRDRRSFIIDRPMGWFIGGVGLLFSTVMITLLWVMEHAQISSVAELFRPVISAYKGLSATEGSIFFTIFVMLQWWNLFNARIFGTDRSAFNLRHCGEFMFIVAVVLVGQILITTFGGGFFNVTALSITDWGIILGCTCPVLVIGEAARAMHRLNRRHK